MELILLEKIRNLGSLGDVVNVRSGYGRNFLIPQGKAIPATEKNREVFKTRRAELEKNAEMSFEQAKQRAQQIMALTEIKISARAAEEGKLYGSVNNTEIVDALKVQGIEVARREVMLPNGPIRHAGEYDIDIVLHTDVTAVAKIVVVAE